MTKFSALYSSNTHAFTYTPPAASYGTVRVLVIGGETVRPEIFKAVLRGLWRYTPHTRILIAEHPSLDPERMLGANMAVVDMETIPLRPYVNSIANRTVHASTLLSEADLCISVASVTAPLQASPSLEVLRGLSQRPVDAHQAFFTLGNYFGGAVVDTGDKVYWGDDLLEVDRSVYRALAQPPDTLLEQIIETRHKHRQEQS